MRCFLAVAPGERLRAELSTRLDDWRTRWDLGWTTAANLHVTLRFLGEWPADRLDDLQQAVAEAVRGRAAFPVRPTGLDAFPDWRAPRVLFLHLDDAEHLADLAAALDAAVAARCPGLGRPAGPFRAHLTLARIRRPLPPPALAGLRALAPGSLPAFTADAVRLVESRLRPDGPVYVDQAVFPLASPD